MIAQCMGPLKRAKSGSAGYVRMLVVISVIFYGTCLRGQDVPSLPLSYPVYNPMIINPAFVGSKDFTNISITSKLLKSPSNQILNVHKRLTARSGFFSGVGVGGFLFQEQLDESWNAGLGAVGAYHISLDKNSIHILAIGVSAKGILNVPKKNDEFPADSLHNHFNPNMDAGIYYYGPTAFVGVSSTSLFGTKPEDSIAMESDAYISRQYHLYGGYKFLVNRANSIVLEPSILVTVDDSTLAEPYKHIVPYFKVYLQNFYVGTYFRSLDEISLFFQYQFPRFHTGVFLQFPRKGFLNDDNIIIEICAGVNLGGGGERFLQYRHW